MRSEKNGIISNPLSHFIKLKTLFKLVIGKIRICWYLKIRMFEVQKLKSKFYSKPEFWI